MASTKKKKGILSDELVAECCATKAFDPPRPPEFPYVYATVYDVLLDLINESMSYIDQLTGRELMRLTNIKTHTDEWAVVNNNISIVKDIGDILFILQIANRVGLGRFDSISGTQPVTVKFPQKSSGDETLPPPFEKNQSKWFPNWVENFRSIIAK